ncbi:MAG TPA: hypothetical protein VFJ87_04915 [Rhodanobacteraceae bacterium]|nr:hypothetical protein [Rhodanobacteraceae bacterium]
MDDMEATVRTLSGTVTALEFAIKVLIFTHPDKRGVCAAWEVAKARQIELFMENPAFENDTLRNAILTKLADLDEYFTDTPDQEWRDSRGT